MKKLLVLLVSAISFSSSAQTVTNQHLDSLIWKEINEYRQTLGVPQVTKFNLGEMRKISYGLTQLNSTRPGQIDHTRGAGAFVGYNSECIYQFALASTKRFTSTNLTEAELQELAKTVVTAWINSPDHNYLIGSKLVAESTVTSVMTRENGRFVLTVSYHDKIRF